MLTPQDIKDMKENRKEIINNRQTLITIGYENAGIVDEFTGEITGKTMVERDVLSVVTEVSSLANASTERVLQGGIAAEKGDLWLSIDYDLVSDISDLLTRLRYDGKWYSILASDKKGIGSTTRIEVLGRLIT